MTSFVNKILRRSRSRQRSEPQDDIFQPEGPLGPWKTLASLMSEAGAAKPLSTFESISHGDRSGPPERQEQRSDEPQTTAVVEAARFMMELLDRFRGPLVSAMASGADTCLSLQKQQLSPPKPPGNQTEVLGHQG